MIEAEAREEGDEDAEAVTDMLEGEVVANIDVAAWAPTDDETPEGFSEEAARGRTEDCRREVALLRIGRPWERVELNSKPLALSKGAEELRMDTGAVEETAVLCPSVRSPDTPRLIELVGTELAAEGVYMGVVKEATDDWLVE